MRSHLIDYGDCVEEWDDNFEPTDRVGWVEEISDDGRMLEVHGLFRFVFHVERERCNQITSYKLMPPNGGVWQLEMYAKVRSIFHPFNGIEGHVSEIYHAALLLKEVGTGHEFFVQVQFVCDRDGYTCTTF